MQKIIAKEQLQNKIEELLKEFEIIGPKELSGKGVFYQPITDAKELCLDADFTIEPVKKFFLEPSSCILSCSQGKELKVEVAAQAQKKRIIIGVRPCEARGLELLDKVFNGEPKDSFYMNNRQRTLIIGLSCAQPDKSCFCTSMGGSPAEARGMDALLFNTENRFIAEVLTDKGREIFGSLGKNIDQAQKKSLDLDKKRKKDLVKTKIKVPESLDKLFESDYWQRVSRPCIGCGVCTYLCPTCHCFDLVDERRKRLRCYDGCSFPEFTLEASGENPRPGKRERYRQRVFHKFDYFKKNFGENLCLGCGRCIRHCPVKMDISEIISKVPSQ